jgi:hypothetical protein
MVVQRKRDVCIISVATPRGVCAVGSADHMRPLDDGIEDDDD